MNVNFSGYKNKCRQLGKSAEIVEQKHIMAICSLEKICLQKEL